jgi:glyoxylase-like metal-dependent hydrolase (beta-lactamase superfamily II)
VRLMQLGRGHTKGDIVVWLPEQKILFSGDLVEAESACYAGDAYLSDWPQTLERVAALEPEKLVPGRGPALLTRDAVKAGLDYTRAFVSALYTAAREAVAQGMDLKAAMTHTRHQMDPRFSQVFIYEHCLPFDVTRAYDEASGVRDPRIWTAERDREMWAALQG